MKDNSNTRPVGVLSKLRRPLPEGIVDFRSHEPLEIDDLEIEPDPEADARLDRQAEFDARLIGLTPSERVVYLALAPILDTHGRVRERLAGGGRLMLSLRLPGEEWQHSVRAAVETWLADIRIELPDVGQIVRTRTPSSDRWGKRPVFDVRTVWRDIAGVHLMLVRWEEDELDETVEVALDADIHLSEIPFAIFADVLRERFGGDREIEKPEGFAASNVDPVALNSAVARVTSAAEAMALVDAMSAAARRREAILETARKADEKAKIVARQAITATFPTSPKLSDLHGYGAAQAWGQALCDDLAAYRSGDLSWSDVDTGCLLAGPPGTGKTLYASALAASSGLPFFATSFAHWQGSRGGHLGDVVKAMRDWFATASDAAPSILFVDEFDSIPARGGSKEHDDYWTPIVNGLLELLDGTARREGLVVIAACNNADKIDPALVRSGRLDRRFEIGLPGETDLVRIFGHHLPELAGPFIEPVATALAGTCSGADAARIAREARRIARRAKRDIVAADLLAIALPEDKRSPALRRLVAVHEAGHAVAMIVTGQIPTSLSIVESATRNGGVGGTSGIDLCVVEEIEAGVIVSLAGRAAEEIILGRVSGGASADLTYSTALLTRAFGHFGLNGRLLSSETVDGHAVEARLQALYARSLRLVTERRTDIEALADLALERRVLSQRALAEFARERGLGGDR